MKIETQYQTSMFMQPPVFIQVVMLYCGFSLNQITVRTDFIDEFKKAAFTATEGLLLAAVAVMGCT